MGCTHLLHEKRSQSIDALYKLHVSDAIIVVQSAWHELFDLQRHHQLTLGARGRGQDVNGLVNCYGRQPPFGATWWASKPLVTRSSIRVQVLIVTMRVRSKCMCHLGQLNLPCPFPFPWSVPPHLPLSLTSHNPRVGGWEGDEVVTHD